MNNCITEYSCVLEFKLDDMEHYYIALVYGDSDETYISTRAY